MESVCSADWGGDITRGRAGAIYKNSMSYLDLVQKRLIPMPAFGCEFVPFVQCCHIRSGNYPSFFLCTEATLFISCCIGSSSVNYLIFNIEIFFIILQQPYMAAECSLV